MVANLGGIARGRLLGDTSGGTEFDTDGDGAAAREHEPVSFINLSGAPVDTGGRQVWPESTGAYAPDSPQDGPHHTFPSGTVIQPGKSFYMIAGVSDPNGRHFAEETSVGGVDSGAGGKPTSFPNEDTGGNFDTAVCPVNPAIGDRIVST